MFVVTMERKIEKVIVLYQDSSNPISYWVDMSQYKDMAGNLTGCSLMGTRPKNDRGMGGPRGGSGANS